MKNKIISWICTIVLMVGMVNLPATVHAEETKEILDVQNINETAENVKVEDISFYDTDGYALDTFNDKVRYINIDFNQSIDISSIATGDITLKNKYNLNMTYIGELSEDKYTYSMKVFDPLEVSQKYVLKVSGVNSVDGNSMTKAYEIPLVVESEGDIFRVNYDDFDDEELKYFRSTTISALEGTIDILQAGTDDPVDGNYALCKALWPGNGEDWINVGYELDEAMEAENDYKLTLKFATVSGNGYHGLALTNQSGETLDSGWSDTHTIGVVTPKSVDGGTKLYSGYYPCDAAYSGTITTWERDHWYELDATFSNGAMTAIITDLSNPDKTATAKTTANYDGVNKILLRAGHVMKIDDIRLTQVSAVTSPILFEADFDKYSPGIEVIGSGSSLGGGIDPGAPDGTNYFYYNPGTWLTNGWSLSQPMKKDGTYYDVSFDFKLNQKFTAGTSYYPIVLSQKSLVRSSPYKAFGLMKPGDDNKFYIAGMRMDGVEYDPNRWYSYNLSFNPLSRYADVTITEKAAPYRKATYKGIISDGEHGYHNSDNMPNQIFDCIRFSCNPNIGIDNILVRKSEGKPISVQVTSDHVGNIFDGDDPKTLKVKLTNTLGEAIKADISYKIYNNSGKTVKSGTIDTPILAYNEVKTVDVNAGDNLKYGTYKIQIFATAESASMPEAVSFESDEYKFSVANKVKVLNETTAVNIERIYSMEEWAEYKEVIMQAGLSGIRFDLPWSEVSNGAEDGFKPASQIGSTVIYEDAYNSGIDILAILNTTSPVSWQRPDVAVTSSLSAIQSSDIYKNWKSYIEYAAATFGKYVHGFEIQNEPTWWSNGWVSAHGDRFVELYLKPANKIIKDLGVTSKVYGLSSASIWYAWMDPALSAMKQGGGADKYMDVAAIHPYDFSSDGWNDSHFKFPVEIYPTGTEMQDTMNSSNNHSVVMRDRIWHAKMSELNSHFVNYDAFNNITRECTEIGVTVTEGSASERMQAADIAQLFALTEATNYYDRIWYFNLENYQNMGSEDEIPAHDKLGSSYFGTEGGWGLLCNYEDTVPLAAKEAYISLCAYNAMVGNTPQRGDWKYVSYQNNPSSKNHTSFYGFENRDSDGKDVFMLWTDPADVNMTCFENLAVDLGADTADIYDMYSNYMGTIKAEENENGAKVFNFTSGMEPIYIVGDFTKCAINDNTVQMTGRTYGLPGDTVEINVTDVLGRNLKLDIEDHSGKLEVVAPAELTNGKATIKATILPGAYREEEIIISVSDGNNIISTAKSYVNIKKANIEWVEDMSTSSATPIYTYNAITASGNDRVRVTVENLGASALNTNIIIAYYDDDGRYIDSKVVSAKFTKRGDDQPVTTNIGMVEGATQIKIMHWDKNKNMRPVSDSLYYIKP